MPCKTNQYGKLCLRKCACAFHQRCDNALGCVNESILTEPASSQSTTCYTENYAQTTAPNLSEESEITKSSDGLLDREIVIYSIVVACIIVILGLSYVVQKYRKKTKNEPRHITVPVTLSNGRDSLVDTNLSIYDEIDETMLVENANINVLQNEISLNNDNTSYLYPIHLEDDKRSSSVSAKSVNNSYLSIHESDQNHNSDESDKNDTTSYLHPYHTIDEEWKETTHQYDEPHVSNKDTDDSSDSSTQMISDGYLHPYQPLNDDWKQTSHSYEVPVMVHDCQRNSAVPSLSDEEFKEKGNDDYQKTIIKHNKCVQIREAAISTCNKQGMADGISLNDEMKDISSSIGNNLGISKELKNTKNISTSYPPSTKKENALVPVVESDTKVFDKNEDNLHAYNLLKNVTIQTVFSIQTDQNTNLHDYTDAKSQ
ncbi:uncharacterized protein LOC143074082 [Mytilus galloprovincialis]|uniref:uncharacterized protein LOC143074082 n=1 Tax=Mytilus galloprovincialis TaxID=29158 RepID=UPI003F7C00DA